MLITSACASSKGKDDPNFRSFGDEMKRLYIRVVQLDDTRELQDLSRVHGAHS